jgi:hypothetical protein
MLTRTQKRKKEKKKQKQSRDDKIRKTCINSHCRPRTIGVVEMFRYVLAKRVSVDN